MKIIKFEEIYRDDMIFMVLQAKDALGRKPTINPDLLDIKANYLDYNDMFWLVIDENDRVVGRHDPCIVPRAVPAVEAVTAVTMLDIVL